MLHRLVAAPAREADPVEDDRDPLAYFGAGHPVEARGVAEVLLGRHLLEEGGLNRDAVHEPLDRARLAEDVMAEDVRAAAVVQEQCREQTDKRRLARAVLAQDRDALAALNRERGVL